jgi:hypothetical protein
MRGFHRTGLAAVTIVAALAVMSAPTATAVPRAAAAPADCPRGYFCGYKNANFRNLAFKFQDCYMQEIPDDLNSGGSWYNNQSRGTQARMYNMDKKLIYTTPGAPSSDASGDWGPVWYVDAC